MSRHRQKMMGAKLSAEMLDTYDRCERRFAFSQSYTPTRISPMGLLYSALEAALVDSEPEQRAKDVTLAIAKDRELDTEHSRWMTVRHTGYLAGILATVLQEQIGTLQRLEPVEGLDFEWHSNLFRAEDKRLHRIVLVSHWDDDTLRQFAHSWGTIGELAALQRPVTLTAVVIGNNRQGRRHSAWTRGYTHPVNHGLRFKKRDGSKLEGWDTVWRDQSTIPTEKWIAGMRSDAVIEELILSREIRYDANDNRMAEARRDAGLISIEMPNAREDSPMRRHSCDDPIRGVCPFAHSCYSKEPSTPADSPHLYRPVDTPREAPASSRPQSDTASQQRPFLVGQAEPHLPASRT